VLTFPVQAERERKIFLLQRARDAFDNAQYWDYSVQICKQLTSAYETQFYDIDSLIKTQNLISSYWQRILTTDRLFGAYYRVAFFGAGFLDVEHKELIYRSGRGVGLESIMEFTNRIKAKYPGAIVVNTSDAPPKKYTNQLPGTQDKDTQYIQVTTLRCSSGEELMGQPSKFEQTPLSPSMLKYHEQNNVHLFCYTRKDTTNANRQRLQREVENEYQNIWIEKIFLITSFTMPSHIRIARVEDTQSVVIGPLENAVNMILSKNRDIRRDISRLKGVSASNRHDIGPLSMNLSGVIDAAVMGGIERYIDAFFQDDYLEAYPEHAPLVPKFRFALGEQLEVLKEGLELFGAHCDKSVMPLYEHLLQTYRRMKTDLMVVLNVDEEEEEKMLQLHRIRSNKRQKKERKMARAVLREKRKSRIQSTGSRASKASPSNGRAGGRNPSSFQFDFKYKSDLRLISDHSSDSES
jgi:dedicator of cytokinesis protein 3